MSSPSVKFPIQKNKKYLSLEKIVILLKKKKIITTQSDIANVNFKSDKNCFYVQLKDSREVIIHPYEQEIENIQKRWTTTVIQIHEGSIFSTKFRDMVVFPVSVMVIFLWISGVILGIVLIFRKRRKRNAESI